MRVDEFRGNGIFWCDPVILFKDDYNLERVKEFGLFSTRSEVSEIILPKSVKHIEENAIMSRDGFRHIYYAGTKEDFEKIEIIDDNGNNFVNCTVFYYSEAEPVDDGNLYWRYVDGVPTSWTLIDEVPGSGGAGSSGSC